MIAFRDEITARLGVKLLVHVNQEGVSRGISAVASGSSVHTRVMKTEALGQALDQRRYDVVLGGARRDKERSRAKEPIFSHRSAGHIWNLRGQRPEFWRLFKPLRHGDAGLGIAPDAEIVCFRDGPQHRPWPAPAGRANLEPRAEELNRPAMPHMAS